MAPNNKEGFSVRHKMMYVRGHIEIFDQTGQFLFSADNEMEALNELTQYVAEQEAPAVVA